MTALLYISYSSGLSEDKIIKTDRYVIKNRWFVRNLDSNSKRKTKRVLLYVTFIFQLGQPLVSYAAAVIMLLPPQISIEHLVPAEVLRSNNQCAGIAPITKAKMDKITLTDQQIEDLNLICYKLQTGSITIDKTILELQAGGFYDWATLGFIIYMFSLQQGNSFQNVPLPHQDPFGWLSGKYDSRNVGNGQCLSHPPSRFERETLHTMKQMCAASADENGFVMNYDEAYNLIKETYGGSMQITEDCKITDWQGAKKSYHFQKDFGIDLGKYQNISKEDLVSLQNTDGGLIPYVRKGGKLPPIEFTRDCQQKIYDFCHLENTEINRDVTHYGKNIRETPCIMFFNRETRQIALFNKTSGDLITAEKFRQNYFTKCIDSGQVGKPTN